MVLLNIVDLSLPLKNPVLIFSLILFVILFAPILLNKLRIPHLIGLIIAGVIIGPYGLNLLLRDSSVVLFGTVGLLYIMFLAGLEIDIAEFKKNSGKSLVFGFYTFTIPMVIGTFASIYVLKFSVETSILLSSMFASHTLITYPIVSKFGVNKNRVVNITIGGTLITDMAALLVLAVFAGMATGELSHAFWFKLSISVILFGAFVMLVFPIIGRWFFKKYDDHISQYIFVLGMVFFAAFLAEAAGIEAIIGAFLAGLALNRLIQQTSPLMNRINFVGNALFIPFFLIGVGMLIDYRAFFKSAETIKVGVTMIVLATLSKFMAAWLTQKTFRFTADERRLIFGLSNSRVAATLAAVLVGYNIIVGHTESGEPIRLLNESILNGTILMILVTCTIASFVTQKGAQNIALEEKVEPEKENDPNLERILIPINNLENAEELINLSMTIKSKLNKTGIFVLNILNNSSNDKVAEKNAQKIVEKATQIASATDIKINPLLRYDMNIVNGINSVVREHKINYLIIGLHSKRGLTDSFLGNLTDGILNKCSTTTLIYKSFQPLATIKRTIVIVPERAEREMGFPFWLVKVWNIGRNTGTKLIFYASAETIEIIREIHDKHPLPVEYESFKDWRDFVSLSDKIKINDNLVIVMSRRSNVSYNEHMALIPNYLNRHFTDKNFILIYPNQSYEDVTDGFDLNNPSLYEPIKEELVKLDELRKTVFKLFSQK